MSDYFPYPNGWGFFLPSYFPFFCTFIGMSISKAQAKALADGFIDSLGEGGFVKGGQFSLLDTILLEYGKAFNESVIENLTKENIISSGDLLDIPFPRVYATATGYTLEIGYEIGSKQYKYFDYINKGVQGKGGKNAKLKRATGDYKFKNAFPNRAMALSIFKWLNTARKKTSKYAPISGLERKRKKLTKILNESENKRKLAYAISVGIKKNGIRATFFYDKAKKIIYSQDFRDSVAEVMAAQFDVQINSINKK